jgi:TPR repeat protein
MSPSFLKIAVPITYGVVICGAAIFWRVHQGNQLADEMKTYRVADERGDAQAEFKLASAYYHGKGAPQDLAEAARRYRRAADQGDAAAQYGLANSYSNGIGVPQDNIEPARWYRRYSTGDTYHAPRNC